MDGSVPDEVMASDRERTHTAEMTAQRTLDEARAQAERLRAAAVKDAATIRATARAEFRSATEQFDAELSAMEAEIAKLSAQLTALESDPASPVSAPRPGNMAPASEAGHLIHANVEPGSSETQASSRTPEGQAGDDAPAADCGEADLAPLFIEDAPPISESRGVRLAANTEDSQPKLEPVTEGWLSSVSLGPVLPMVAVVVVLVIVLAVLG